MFSIFVKINFVIWAIFELKLDMPEIFSLGKVLCVQLCRTAWVWALVQAVATP